MKIIVNLHYMSAFDIHVFNEEHYGRSTVIGYKLGN